MRDPLLPCRVLVTDDYARESLAHLAKVEGITISVSSHLTPSSKNLLQAQALLIRSRTIVHEKLLEQAPQLKVIVTATSGFDHIDLKLCENRGIAVAHSPESQVQSVAELTLLFMLSLARNSKRWPEALVSERWRSSIARGSLLSGKELGIVGLGRIGSRVAKLTQALGLKVSACDPYIDSNRFTELDVTPMGYNELLRNSDIVSYHVPLTRETQYMLNRSNLDALSSTSWVINTARGGVINEVDLGLALERGDLGAAALDVFESEPLRKDSLLHKLPNVVLSPHLGAYSEQSFAEASNEACTNLLNFLQGGELRNRLTR